MITSGLGKDCIIASRLRQFRLPGEQGISTERGTREERTSLNVRVGAIKSVGHSHMECGRQAKARRRFGLCLCPIHLKTSLSSQSGVALSLAAALHKVPEL